MTIAHALTAARRAAEQRMTDTVTISRPGEPTYDDDTLAVITDNGQVLYAGVAEVVEASAEVEEDLGAGRDVSTLRLTLRLPVVASAVGLHVDDLVVVDTSSTDPELVGRTMRIAAVPRQTHAKARRLTVEEVTS